MAKSQFETLLDVETEKFYTSMFGVSGIRLTLFIFKLKVASFFAFIFEKVFNIKITGAKVILPNGEEI